VAVVSASAAQQSRQALWGVVQLCRINYETTGAAFPCLEVNVAEGAERGYVILRPPVGAPDFILSPTRKSPGVEDTGLAAEGAPNYFEMAWRARSILGRGATEPIADDDFAFAVNSDLSRTQDQLHIHMGCQSRETKQRLAAAAPELSASRWQRLGRPIAGMRFWARTIGQDSLEGANPFRLVSEGLPEAATDRGAVTIVVAGARSTAGRNDFVLLASIGDRSRSYAPHAAGNDLLRRSCS
jgi:CDP-diacylglycerol pyrophosphatase